MNTRIVFCLLLAAVSGAPLHAQGSSPDAVAIARTFLPPRTELEQIAKYDPRSGDLIEQRPAVLVGHILSPKSRDIALAYKTPGGKGYNGTLFISLLHETEGGYVKIYERAYYDQLLWVQDFSTVGLSLLPVAETETQAIAAITGIGASLGGKLEVFKWDDTWGLTDVMPANGSVHGFGFAQQKEGLRITLSYAKSPSDKSAPPPISYFWNGNRVVKTP